MKIKSIHIENFRSFQDETIYLNKYSCFVGPNGAGKSSVLAALNVFFKDQTSFDTNNLEDEDYFCRDTGKPIRITVTFNDLSVNAIEELSDYVRQGELAVTAEAVFDPRPDMVLLNTLVNALALMNFEFTSNSIKPKHQLRI